MESQPGPKQEVEESGAHGEGLLEASGVPSLRKQPVLDHPTMDKLQDKANTPKLLLVYSLK